MTQALFSEVDGGSVWYLVTRGSEGVTRFLLIDSFYTLTPINQNCRRTHLLHGFDR